MGVKKNVASQKIGFPMVDKTDFATPEAGISPTGVIRKDGGASATVSNTVSELTNGNYVLTMSQGETNGNLLQFRFHDSGASCATQFVNIYTDDASLSEIESQILIIDNKVDSILVDTTSILVDTGTTLGNKIDSILADTTSILVDTTSILVDTKTTLPATLSEMKSQISDIESQVALILIDTSSTLDNKLDSILVDTGTTLPAAISNVHSQVSDIESQVELLGGDTANITSILADTKSLIVDVSLVHSAVDENLSHLNNGTYGLDALETIVSQVLQDTGTTLVASISEMKSQLSDIESQTTVILIDTSSTLDNKIDSVLVDTGTTLPASISNVHSQVSDIESQVELLGGDTANITSILADTKSIIVDISNVHSQVSDIESQVGVLGGDSNNITSILADTKSLLVDVSDVHSAVDENLSHLNNGAYGLDALETIVSQVLQDTGTTLPASISNVHSQVSDIESQVELLGGDSNNITSILADTQSIIVDLSNIHSQVSDVESQVGNLGGDSNNITSILADTQSLIVDVSNVHSAVDEALSHLDNGVYGLDALETIVSDVLSTIDGPVISDLSNIESIVGVVAASLPPQIVRNQAFADFPFEMINLAGTAALAGVVVTATRSIDGGAYGACTNAVVEVSNGSYVIDLSAADLNGRTIKLRFTGALCRDNFIGLVTQG